MQRNHSQFRYNISFFLTFQSYLLYIRVATGIRKMLKIIYSKKAGFFYFFSFSNKVCLIDSWPLKREMNRGQIQSHGFFLP